MANNQQPTTKKWQSPKFIGKEKSCLEKNSCLVKPNKKKRQKRKEEKQKKEESTNTDS